MRVSDERLAAIVKFYADGNDVGPVKLPGTLGDLTSELLDARAEIARLRESARPWGSEEELAEAIQTRQVLLRNVDGGTNIGNVTPADAAMLARVALSRARPLDDTAPMTAIYNARTGTFDLLEFPVGVRPHDQEKVRIVLIRDAD